MTKMTQGQRERLSNHMREERAHLRSMGKQAIGREGGLAQNLADRKRLIAVIDGYVSSSPGATHSVLTHGYDPDLQPFVQEYVVALIEQYCNQAGYAARGFWIFLDHSHDSLTNLVTQIMKSGIGRAIIHYKVSHTDRSTITLYGDIISEVTLTSKTLNHTCTFKI